MRRNIPVQHIQGRASRQAHAGLPEGTVERELGREGFFGPASHMYHRHAPTGWTSWEGPLRPRAFDLKRLVARATSPFDAQEVLANAALRLRIWAQAESMDHLVRNADGDELVFVHRGAGTLFCDYGRLAFEAGDYIVLPRSTMWRVEIDEPVVALLIQATNNAYRLPDRGSLGGHAVFDPAMLDVPAIDEGFLAQQDEKTWRVVVKRREALSTVTYPFNPLDAVGWKGDLMPVRLNVRDIRPVMSHRYHVPPSAHTTFLADRFVVCTFVPRPFETDPDAIKVPFFHNNDDYDEAIFYHAGDFFSRDNIDAGMLTFHPSGFTHGPHPKALANMLVQKKAATDEFAVMIDARDPLEPAAMPDGVELEHYAMSWAAKEETR